MPDEDTAKLVIARLESMPDNIEINLGNLGTLQKADLISHVKRGDELGKKIIDMQMDYLKSLKSL